MTPEERRIVQRTVMAVVIPIAFIMLLIGAVGLLVYRNDADQKIDRNEKAITDNQKAIAREATLRTQFNQRINQFVFDQCVLDEGRDLITVELLRTSKRNTLTAVAQARKEGRPVNPELLADVIASLDDAINALEPEGEQDCALPSTTDIPKGK